MRRFNVIILSTAVLAAATVGAVVAARSEAHEQQVALPAEFADVSGIAVAEVRDAAGKVILDGAFTGNPEANGDLERKARLAAKDGSAATGEAEIEVSRSEKSGTKSVEVELDVSELAASTTYTLHLDGRQAASFTTDAKGEAEIELVPDAGK
jgi:hypothetical protein